MEVSQIRNKDKVTYIIKGKIDANMEPVLAQALQLEGINDLTFDFKDVDYIFSAGLRVLLKAQKQMNAGGGKMKIINANDTIKKMLQIVGFDNIMLVE
jgi:anti-sigma B factor antagonist